MASRPWGLVGSGPRKHCVLEQNIVLNGLFCGPIAGSFGLENSIEEFPDLDANVLNSLMPGHLRFGCTKIS